jgi:hypothetical protein
LYGLEGQGSIPCKDKIFIYSKRFIPVQGPTQPPNQWVPEVSFPGIKWWKRESDHSPPSAPEVKNCGAISPLPHTSSGSDSYLIVQALELICSLIILTY